jgi:glycosyltransferase involved in cell wall biosynthesis
MKIILHVSLLNDAQKNVSGIIRAASDLSRRRGDFVLHIVGEGVDRARLEGLAREQGLLDKKVFFHGSLNTRELIDYFRNAHLFVLFSNFETFSVVTAEALACGVPVIVTRCGGPEEYVDETCGLVIEPRDEDSLVEAMDYILGNLSKYDSKKISQYAHSRFGADTVGRMICRMYLSTLRWPDTFRK